MGNTHPRKWSEKAGCWLYWSASLARYVVIPDDCTQRSTP